MSWVLVIIFIALAWQGVRLAKRSLPFRSTSRGIGIEYIPERNPDNGCPHYRECCSGMRNCACASMGM